MLGLRQRRRLPPPGASDQNLRWTAPQELNVRPRAYQNTVIARPPACVRGARSDFPSDPGAAGAEAISAVEERRLSATHRLWAGTRSRYAAAAPGLHGRVRGPRRGRGRCYHSEIASPGVSCPGRRGGREPWARARANRARNDRYGYGEVLTSSPFSASGFPLAFRLPLRLLDRVAWRSQTSDGRWATASPESFRSHGGSGPELFPKTSQQNTVIARPPALVRAGCPGLPSNPSAAGAEAISAVEKRRRSATHRLWAGTRGLHLALGLPPRPGTAAHGASARGRSLS